MKATLDLIQKLTPAKRRDFRDNNRAKLDDARYGEQARRNLELLESSGLPLAPDRELRDGDWQLRKIEIIINSSANEALLVKAAAQGDPPLGAIEPLIREALVEEYRSDRRDTVQAGYLVGNRMYALGYDKVEGGEKPMPPGSIARTAATFRKRRQA